MTQSYAVRISVTLAALALLARAGDAQTVTANLPLTGPPGAVAVNPATNKIYVAGSGANQTVGTVVVIDGATNETLTLATGISSSSIAVNPVTNKVYVANFADGSVLVIDAANNNATLSLAVGTAVTKLVVNPVTNKIYAANINDNSVTVIDGASNSMTTVAVGIGPTALAVNPVTNKIYVVNQTSSNVTVIDGATNSTTSIAVGQDPVAVAMDAFLNKIYVANFIDKSVTVINGSSGTVDKTMTVTQEPTALEVNPVTHRLYVAKEFGNIVEMIDGVTGSGDDITVGTNPTSVTINPITDKIYVVDLGGGATVIDGATNLATAIPAEGVGGSLAAVNPVTNKVYITNPKTNMLTVLDGAAYSKSSVTVGPATEDGSVAVNSVTNRVFVTNLSSGEITELDSANNVVTRIAADLGGISVNAPIAVNPLTNKVYVVGFGAGDSSTIGTVTAITLIDDFNYDVTAIPVGYGAVDVAVNPVSNKIYVANAGGKTVTGTVHPGSVTVIDGASDSAITIATGGSPSRLAVNPATNKIYVADLTGFVKVIDGSSNTMASVAVGKNPEWLAVNSITNKIYVSNSGSNTVTVIDGVSNLTTTVATGTFPAMVAANQITNKIYVVNFGDSTLTIIDGKDNSTKTVTAGTGLGQLAVNPTTNKIYVTNEGGFNNPSKLFVLDGVTNTLIATIPAGTGLSSLAVNPFTNTVYMLDANTLTEITDEPVQPNPLTTSITPLAGNQTSSPTPAFTFHAQSTNVAQPNAVFFQVDTVQNAWTAASGSNPTFTGTLHGLQPGLHTLYAYAADGQEATSTQPRSPFIGVIQTYEFLVTSAQVSVAITNPAAGSVSGTVTLSATASTTESGATIQSVQFQLDGVNLGSAVTGVGPTYQTQWVTASAANGSHTLSVIATDSLGQSASTSIVVTVANGTSSGGASATFVKTDTSTQGSWTSTYGGDGYIIANGTSNPPGYATVTPTGVSTWTWYGSTSDPRALLKGSSTTDRIASTFYGSTTFSFDVTLTGGPHQVALYLLDFDTTSRSETISIVDPATNATLDGRSFTNFHNGVYGVWNLQGHVTIRVQLTGGLNAVMSGLFLGAAGSVTVPAPPTVSLTGPSANASLSGITNITAQAQAAAGVASIQFLLDNAALGSPVSGAGPYSFSWNTASVSNGAHTLAARATDTLGQKTTSSPVPVQVSNVSAPPGTAAALFVRVDAATQGNWKGTYGADGSLIAGDSNNLPGYAAVTPANAALYTWSASTTDARAPLKYASSTDRIAATYYSYPSFTLDVNLSGTQAHQVALYLLDWDYGGRAETITIFDAATNAVLDTRTVAGFQGGQYLVWNITGHVTLQVKQQAGQNAVVSAVFFDSSGATSGNPPVISITAPTASQTVSGSVTLSAIVTANAGVSSVQFQLDGSNLSPIAQSGSTYSYQWNSATTNNGSHTFRVSATDNASQQTTASVTFTVTNASGGGAAATFVKKDAATRGSWKTVYGQGGEIIANDSNLPPSYAQTSFSGAASFTWALTSDPGALQQATGSSRTASTFYGAPSFSLDVNLMDGNPHQLALYFLDWDNQGRSETVQILDAGTQQVLDVETVANFQRGFYLVWNVKGHVVVRFTDVAGANAVVSGVFF